MKFVLEEVAEALPVHSDPSCKCKTLSPALNKLCSQPVISRNAEARVAVDRALVQGGLSSARDARRHTNAIDKEGSGKDGRPSKVDDKECVHAVGEVITQSSCESADVVKFLNPLSQTVEAVCKRCRTIAWWAIFWASSILISLMSFPTSHAIKKKYDGFVRKGQRRIDVCDHCMFFEQQVLPNFWLNVRRYRESFEQLWQC